MKLCIIASGDYFSSYGGGQIYVKNLVQALKQRGHAITVISLSVEDINKSITVTKELDGITVIQIKLSNSLEIVEQPLELQNFFTESLKSNIQNINPEIVHAHGWKYATAIACEKLSVPCVVTAHHGGITCPNGKLLNNQDAICDVNVSMQNCLKCALHFVPAGDFFAPILSHIPKASSISIAKYLKNRKNIPYISPAFQTPLGITHKLQQIETLRDFSVHIVAPSHAIASALKRNGIKDDKLIIIPHGITPLTKKPLVSELANRPVRFGYVGRVTYVKGLHVLIKSLKTIANQGRYELHIYGEGATKEEKRYESKLKKISQNLPIIWHGKVNNTQIQEAYHDFDMMVHPAIYLEVFGLTLLESLSSGRPVIATRCGGPEDFIKDGVDGILIEPNNSVILAQTIKQYIDNPNLIEKLYKSIRPINTLNKHVIQLEKTYKDLRNKI